MEYFGSPVASRWFTAVLGEKQIFLDIYKIATLRKNYK